MLRAITTSIYRLSTKLNWVAAAALIFIMLLTCADVVMRFFGSPIPGTYELVGYFGSVIISFGMAHTSIERGHIAVNLLVDRLPPRAQTIIEGVGNIAAAVLFGILSMAMSSIRPGHTGNRRNFSHSGNADLALRFRTCHGVRNVIARSFRGCTTAVEERSQNMTTTEADSNTCELLIERWKRNAKW